MFSLGRRKATLRALGREVPLKTLPHLQPIFLLQMLIGLSQVLNGSAVQPEALARAFILDGQHRLRKLRNSTPHLNLSLEHLLEKIRPADAVENLSDEERAVQAMLQVCLGLILRWLSRADDPSHPRASSVAVACLPFSKPVLLSYPLSPPLLFRARSCLIF